MVIHATLSNCSLGKPLFLSTNNVSFFIEKVHDKILTISILPEESLKTISQMLSGFFEKGSNMYGFDAIIVKTSHATLTVYPHNKTKEIEKLLENLTRITAYIWEDSDS